MSSVDRAESYGRACASPTSSGQVLLVTRTRRGLRSPNRAARQVHNDKNDSVPLLQHQAAGGAELSLILR